MSFKKYSGISLHIYISTLFLSLIVAFAAITLTVQYFQTRAMLLDSTRQLFGEIGQQANLSLRSSMDLADMASHLLSTSNLAKTMEPDQRKAFVPFLAGVLENATAVDGINMAYTNGDFFSMRRYDPAEKTNLAAPPPANTAYVVQSIARDAEGTRHGQHLFYDTELQLLETRAMPAVTFDPTVRAWFDAAQNSNEGVLSGPYVFFSTQEVGLTFSHRTGKDSVASATIVLGDLSALLEQSKPSPSAELVVTNAVGDILATSSDRLRLTVQEDGQPALQKVEDLSDRALRSIAGDASGAGVINRVVDVDGVSWQTFRMPLTSADATYYLSIAAPQNELLSAARQMGRNMLMITLAVMFVAMALALIFSRLISISLNKLTVEAREINALHFNKPFATRSFIREIDRLAASMGAMKDTIRRLLAIGGALGGEKKFDRLLGRILEETISVSRAQGGIVYLMEEDGLLKSGAGLWNGKAVAVASELHPIGDPDHPAIRALGGTSEESEMGPAGFQRWYPGLGGRQHARILCVPLKNRQDDIIGVLMLAQEPEGIEPERQANIVGLVEAVSGTAAVAIEANRLILEQKRLFQGIIELVAGAIDAKSPYTGGHCQRVPALTEMLAHAAADTKTGPFRDFDLSDDQWEELHIAGWLHDCGKVTSPEYVIDKATKLETIHNRLHEIRTRFEVMKREAEVACWQEIAAQQPDEAARQQRLEALAEEWRGLDDDFAFIAQCNIGGEFMSPDRIARVKTIAARRWTRTLDDRIGLSNDELARMAGAPAPELPVREPLLADRPEHVIGRAERDQIPEDNPWGIKMKVPEKLYDRGEIHNLIVSRGTLTEEERYKINEHMVETVRMLHRLPLPRYLKNVPEIACGHHEKMDGTGYPRRLNAGEMSVPARIMAIADIFEALTAGDRPYKKGKTLSEAIGIMADMRDNAHIDPELFDLFLESGVYQTYADAFLVPGQIDPVHVESYRKAS